MAANNPEDDFKGFMEAQAQAAQEELEREAILEQHRIWKETTWDSMRNESSSVFVMIIIRMIIIVICISMVYLGAWLVQSFIGGEIIIEEEEIVVIEGDEDGEEQESDETKKKEQ